MSHHVLSCLWVPLLAASVAAAPPAGRGPEKVPTTDQIYASFEDADYPKVLRQIAAALALKGDAAAAYDRHELLALKGEVLVRQKNFAAAADAFDAAARATIVETKAAVDRSTAELLRRSRAGVYTPAARPGAAAPAPIDVTDPLNRPAAFAALFDDAVAKVEAAVRTAQASGKLPGMLAAFRMLADLRLVEQAAAGGDARSTELARPLTSKARSLMARAVADLSAEVERLGDPARQGQVVAMEGQLWRRDYTPELTDIAAECNRIARVAADLLKAFPGDEADALQKVRDDAAEVELRARSAADLASRGDGGVGGAPYEPLRPVVGPDGQPRGGTTGYQRPNNRGRGAGTAGNRGVGTGGVGSGTR